MRRERLRVITLVLLVVLSSAIMLWLPLFALARASIVTPMFFMLIPLSFVFISKFKKTRKKLRLKSKFSMLLLLTIVLLVTVSIARLFSGTMFQTKPVYAWWDNNWDYCRKITINSSKVDEALTDFPVLVYLNSSRISWANVQDDLDDLRFIANDNTTLLKYEIENYTVNSEAWLWVKIPTVSNTSDISFFMYYGNSGASSGEDAENVWDSNFVAVWHLNETSTGTCYDSTSNDNDGTPSGYDGDEAVTGKIDGADDFDGDDDKIVVSHSSDFNFASGKFTTSFLVNKAWVDENQHIIGHFDSSLDGWYISLQYGIIAGANKSLISFRTNDNTGILAITHGIANDTWALVTFVWDGSTLTGYVNETEKGNASLDSLQSVTHDVWIGTGDYANHEYFDGLLDEVRLSNTSRSASWIKASYETERDDLLDFGTEEEYNTAPTNEGVTITNMHDTNYLYSMERYYQFEGKYNDINGAADLDWVMVSFTDGTNWVNMTFDVGADSWSLLSGSTVAELNTTTCTNSTSGDQLTATWHLRLWWNMSDALNIELYQWCNDTTGATSNWEEKQTNYANIEPNLAISGFACDDDRGDLSQSITFTGTIYYEGASTAPPDDAFSAIHIYDGGDNDKGSDNTISSGAFSVSFNAPATVGIETYNAYIDMAHESYSDNEDSNTDTFITDQIVVYWEQLDDERVNTNSNIEWQIKAVLDYDDTVLGSGDTLSCSWGSLTWDSGNNWWDISHSEATVTSTTISGWSGSEATYTITSLTENITETSGIYDQIVVYSETLDDDRVNINSNIEGAYLAVLDFDDTALASGDTLSCSWGSLSWNGSYWIITHSEASVTGVTISGWSGNEATYTITAITENITETTYKYDQAVVYWTQVNDSRVDINTAIEVRYKIVLDYDDHVVTSGDTVNINGSSATWDGSGYWKRSITEGTVGNWTFAVSSLSEATYTITSFTTNCTDLWGVWDNIVVSDKGRTDDRTNINEYEQFWFTLRSEYDSIAMQAGTVTLNGSLSTTWVAPNLRWEYNTTKASAQKLSLYVASLTWDTYSITSLSSQTSNYTSIIWDSVTISITGPTDQRININTNATGIHVSGTYDYDSTSFDGSLTLNNTTFEYATHQRQGYTVSSLSGDSYGITAISTNDETYCIWDSLTISITGPTDQRIDVEANATGIIVSATYDYDSTSFDGTLTLNDTTYLYSTVGIRGYTVASASGDTHGITVISSNDETYCIWDRIDITIVADSYNPTVGTQVNMTITAIYNYSGIQVISWTVNIYRNSTHYATDNFTDTQCGELVYLYTTENVTETTYDLTAFTSNTETVSWGGLQIEIYEIIVDDGRIDVNTNAHMYFHCRFNVNGSDCTTGTLAANGTNYNINGTGWATVTVSFATVGKRIYTVTGVNVNGETDFNQIPSNPEVIWDNIVVSGKGVTDDRTNINEYEQFWFTLRSEYDSIAVQTGTVTLNGSLSATWAASNSRWEYNTTKSSAQKLSFYVDSVVWDTYGITSLSSQASNYTSIIWDRVLVTISVNSTNPDAGQTVSFTVTAVYDYDDVSLTSWTVNIYRNSTHFATGNFTDQSDSEVKYLYTAENITDNMYDLTAFTSNTVTVVWASLFIEVNEINIQDGRINIGTQATVYYHCRFSSNQSSCTTGTLYVNGTSFTINSTGWATVTFTFSEVCKKALVVTAINVDGETDFQQGPSNPEIIWDRVNVTISADGTYVVLNTQVNFTVTAIYEFDSNPVTSWTVNIYQNSTHFATGNFTDTQASPSVYEYTTENITETTFGLTSFQSNTVTVEWYNSPPVASFTYSPEFPIAGETVTFNAATSYDLDGTITIYTWDFGDGTAIETSPTPIITHIYEMRGNYTVTLTVIDDEGSENKTEVAITVIDYPTADFNYSPTYPIVGETVTFNASTSAPNGGTIVSYFWNFGDGTTANVTSAITTHTYLSFGNYTAILTVKDSEGLTNSSSKVIRIIDYPTADFTYSPAYPIAGETVIFNASTSTPNGGTIVGYFWDFGDGTNSTGLVTSHIYPTFGTYAVTLKVVDSEQLANSTSKLINVRQHPTANFTYSPQLPIVGETVVFNASLSEPHGGAILTYTWDFGGTQTGTGVIANHTYLTYGTYNVTLMVTDSEGLSDSQTQTIRILIWPAANFTYSPKYPLVNQTVEFDGSLSYDPDGAILEYTWDFGDGNVTTVQNPLIMHAYQETDTYLVTLTVKDSDGLSNSITKQVIVYSVLTFPDIAVLNVQTAYSQVYQGYALIIKVTVFNEGYSTETFNVTAYANNIIIETITVSNLPPDEQAVLTFTWDTKGFAEYQNYTISAHVHPVLGEIDTDDNTFVDGVVRLVHIGDVNNDGQVRVDDILAIALAFGSNVGDLRYDPNLDITCDGKIRIDDLLAAVLNFGWTKPYPP